MPWRPPSPAARRPEGPWSAPWCSPAPAWCPLRCLSRRRRRCRSLSRPAEVAPRLRRRRLRRPEAGDRARPDRDVDPGDQQALGPRQGLRTLAPPVGRRAEHRLDQPKSTPRKGLRGKHRERTLLDHDRQHQATCKTDRQSMIHHADSESDSKNDQLRCLEWCKSLACRRDITILLSNRDASGVFSKRVGGNVSVDHYNIPYSAGESVKNTESLFVWNARRT